MSYNYKCKSHGAVYTLSHVENDRDVTWFIGQDLNQKQKEHLIGKCHMSEFKFLCFVLFSVLINAHNSETRYPILMGFASKCSIFKLPESGVISQN